jgi:hypothetical protein
VLNLCGGLLPVFAEVAGILLTGGPFAVVVSDRTEDVAP